MSSESIQKEIIHWNLLTLQQLSSFVDLIERQQKKQKPTKNDYLLRDFYFQPSLSLLKHSRPSFIERSAEIIENFVSFNQMGYLQSMSFDHLMQKHRFWNNIYSMHTRTKEEHEAKQTIKNIVWTYRLVPLTIFFFAAVTLFRISGIYKMSFKKQAVGLAAAAFIADVFVRAKKSSDIFYLIHPLSAGALEDKRIDILNKSLVLDGKINQIELRPSYVDELIDQASKETNPQQRTLILEAAGYTVVDRADFVY